MGLDSSSTGHNRAGTGGVHSVLRRKGPRQSDRDSGTRRRSVCHGHHKGRTVTRRSWVTLVIWCMVLAFGAWFAATRAHVETELSRLFPEGATPTERLLLTELRTGATGRLILIALEGQDAELLAGASKQLAAWMRESGAFHYVGNGEQAWTKQ